MSARKPCQLSGTRKFFDFMNSRTTMLGPSVEYCVCVCAFCVCVREREMRGREGERESERKRERVCVSVF